MPQWLYDSKGEMMKRLTMVFGLLFLLAGTARAEEAVQSLCFLSEVNLPKLESNFHQVQLGNDFVLIASMAPDESEPFYRKKIADELLSIELRERSYSDPDFLAGLELPLPSFTPLNIVLATDDLLNPTCGLRLNLFW